MLLEATENGVMGTGETIGKSTADIQNRLDISELNANMNAIDGVLTGKTAKPCYRSDVSV